MKKISVFILLLVLTFAAFSQEFVWQSSGTTNTLRSIFGVSSAVAWTCGQNGTILSTVDGGTTWVSQSSNTTNILYSLFFVNPQVGWVVGSQSTILKTTNGGSTWLSQNSPESGNGDTFYNVYSLDGLIAWIVTGRGNLLKTTDGGNNWTLLSIPYSPNVYGVSFVDSQTGWIVGSLTGTDGIIWKTTDNGKDWVDQTPTSVSLRLNSVVFRTSQMGWAVGDGGAISRTTNGGQSWTTIHPVSSGLGAVSFSTNQNGWACGADGIVLQTNDGGQTWANEPSSIPNSSSWTLFSIASLPESIGWFVGNHGAILKRTIPRTISFSGQQWFVRNAYGGPGPNYWCDNDSSVWVDNSGYLHLKVRKIGSVCYSSEVSTVGHTHPGVHRFYLIGRPDLLDQNLVFAPFLYRDDTTEIDIEFSKWGRASPDSAQFVVQPSDSPGHVERFPIQLNGTYSTHYFDWETNSVIFKSFNGHYTDPPSGNLINQWTYTGKNIPNLGDTNGFQVHINFWMDGGNAPTNGQDAEMIVSSVDLPLITSVRDFSKSLPVSYLLSQNYPNPFNPTTSISFSLPKASQVTVKVYNVLGDEVTSLISGAKFQPGVFQTSWNGTNFTGAQVSSGMYFYRIIATPSDGSNPFIETKKMLLLK